MGLALCYSMIGLVNLNTFYSRAILTTRPKAQRRLMPRWQVINYADHCPIDQSKLQLPTPPLNHLWRLPACGARVAFAHPARPTDSRLKQGVGVCFREGCVNCSYLCLKTIRPAEIPDIHAGHTPAPLKRGTLRASLFL